MPRQETRAAPTMRHSLVKHKERLQRLPAWRHSSRCTASVGRRHSPHPVEWEERRWSRCSNRRSKRRPQDSSRKRYERQSAGRRDSPLRTRRHHRRRGRKTTNRSSGQCRCLVCRRSTIGRFLHSEQCIRTRKSPGHCCNGPRCFRGPGCETTRHRSRRRWYWDYQAQRPRHADQDERHRQSDLKVPSNSKPPLRNRHDKPQLLRDKLDCLDPERPPHTSRTMPGSGRVPAAGMKQASMSLLHAATGIHLSHSHPTHTLPLGLKERC